MKPGPPAPTSGAMQMLYHSDSFVVVQFDAPGREPGTAAGGYEIVDKTADFAGAFERAWAAPQAALIELRVDPDAITPRTTLTAIRAEAQKAGS